MTQETIVAAALRVGGVIVSAPPPARHHTLLYSSMMQMLWAHSEHIVHPSDQGFLTSTGRFVERAEAYRIVLAANQTLLRPDNQIEHYWVGKHLFSEDLW